MRFNNDMYTHPAGSLVISHYLLKPEECKSLGWLKKRWRQYKKRVLVNKEEMFNSPNTFIDDVRDYFRLPKEELPICYVQSAFNFLFLPYITNNKDEIVVLPIREDGQYPQTWYKKIDYRVLDWKGVFSNVQKEE